MNQAEVSKLVSQLKIKVNPRLRKLSSPGGPEERLNKLRKTVTALIKHERIELNFPRADESRMYAERLISDAIRYGDCHKETMEMADYWIVEKQYVHKLFKVLVPRFSNYQSCFTKIYKAPTLYPENYVRAVLELKGNPYPSLIHDRYSNRSLIHNVLLDEAKKAYRRRKYEEIAAKIDAAATAEGGGASANDVKSVEEVVLGTSSKVEDVRVDEKVEESEKTTPEPEKK